MGSFSSGDQEFGIDDAFLSRHKVQLSHRVHVMNQETMINIIARHTKITTMIANDGFIACELPLPGSVELLIHPPIETEGLLSYVPLKVEILEALLEGDEAPELRI